MFIHNINPTLLKIGSLEIRYYGLIYALGFIIAYFMISYLAQKKGLELTKEDVADFIFYLILGTIIGARLFFVFYNINYFIANPLQVFAVWKGGLIFLGGFIGASLTTYMFCKKKKLTFYKLADIVVVPLALALALGRIGNFLNGEIVGRITNVSWAVKFPGYDGFRHPSQIYEFFKNLFIFGVLWHLKDKKLKDGVMFWSFIVMYSSLRFLVGFFKEADQYGLLLGLTMEQLLFGASFIIGLIFLRHINKK